MQIEFAPTVYSQVTQKSYRQMSCGPKVLFMSPNFLTPPPHLPVRSQITRVAQIKAEITSKSRQE